MAETSALLPGQAQQAPGLDLPVPVQGIPDTGLMELAAQVSSGGPDLSRATDIVGQMMQLAAQLAVEAPEFVEPADQFTRSIIRRLGFAKHFNGGPGIPVQQPPLPPASIIGTPGPIG